MKKLRTFLAQSIRIILIIFGLSFLFGQQNYWLGLGLHFSRWWLIGIGSLFVYWGWKNHRKTATILLITLSLSWSEWAFHTLTFERLEKVEAAESTELSLMSYNVFFKNQYPKAAIQLMKAQNPDVLLIQELTPAWHQRIIKNLGKRYPYRKVKALNGTHGLGIYSKYKLSGVDYANNSARLPIAQFTTLSVKGKVLPLANLHLASPSKAVEYPEHFFEYMQANAELRQKQWIQLLRTIRRKQVETLLLIGDLNTLPYEPLYQGMRKQYADLHAESGSGFGWTFPNTARIPFPFLRLDYALAKGKIQSVETKVLAGGSSDHLPLWCKIRI